MMVPVPDADARPPDEANLARAPRLFVPGPLAAGGRVALGEAQAHYLRHVLRLREGDPVRAFDGDRGEWAARLAADGKRGAALMLGARLRAQSPAPGLILLFAPVRAVRQDYLAQRAAELGVGVLRPVLTARTQGGRVNPERLRANAIEGAEQCGALSVPQLAEALGLAAALDALPRATPLVFCDEAARGDPLDALAGAGRDAPPAVLVGPEGGFTDEERTLVLARPGLVRLALGPRVLRADTAVVAALALVQASLGDWR